MLVVLTPLFALLIEMNQSQKQVFRCAGDTSILPSSPMSRMSITITPPTKDHRDSDNNNINAMRQHQQLAVSDVNPELLQYTDDNDVELFWVGIYTRKFAREETAWVHEEGMVGSEGVTAAEKGVSGLALEQDVPVHMMEEDVENSNDAIIDFIYICLCYRLRRQRRRG